MVLGIGHLNGEGVLTCEIGKKPYKHRDVELSLSGAADLLVDRETKAVRAELCGKLIVEISEVEAQGKHGTNGALETFIVGGDIHLKMSEALGAADVDHGRAEVGASHILGRSELKVHRLLRRLELGSLVVAHRRCGDIRLFAFFGVFRPPGAVATDRILFNHHIAVDSLFLYACVERDACRGVNLAGLIRYLRSVLGLVSDDVVLTCGDFGERSILLGVRTTYSTLKLGDKGSRAGYYLEVALACLCRCEHECALIVGKHGHLGIGANLLELLAENNAHFQRLELALNHTDVGNFAVLDGKFL